MADQCTVRLTPTRILHMADGWVVIDEKRVGRWGRSTWERAHELRIEDIDRVEIEQIKDGDAIGFTTATSGLLIVQRDGASIMLRASWSAIELRAALHPLLDAAST